MYITVHCKVCKIGWDVPFHLDDKITKNEIKTKCPACEIWHKTTISIKHELAYVKGKKVA